jgi:hypothetical protein
MSTLTTPIAYNAVRVLLICWEVSGQKEFEQQLDVLAKEFKEYSFDVERPVYKIKSEQPYRNLASRLHRFLQHDDEGSLLIIYYGGRGLNDEDQNNIWLQ